MPPPDFVAEAVAEASALFQQSSGYDAPYEALVSAIVRAKRAEARVRLLERRLYAIAAVADGRADESLWGPLCT